MKAPTLLLAAALLPALASADEVFLKGGGQLSAASSAAPRPDRGGFPFHVMRHVNDATMPSTRRVLRSSIWWFSTDQPGRIEISERDGYVTAPINLSAYNVEDLTPFGGDWAATRFDEFHLVADAVTCP